MKLKKNTILYRGRLFLAGAVLILSFLIFFRAGSFAVQFFQIQAEAVFLRTAVLFSAGAAVLAFLILLLTFFFGRFYCSSLCPFGILQEVLSIPLRHKKRNVPNLPRLRYFLAGAVCVPVLFGSSRLFRLLAPYSNFGRMTAGFLSGGAVVLFLIIALLIWKKRIWCSAVCPVGTLLGWISKHGVYRLAFSGSCIKCGKCAGLCPTSCMNPKEATIDNERCIRCLECFENCPADGLHFARENRSVPFNVSRREFLKNGGMFLAGAAIGVSLTKLPDSCLPAAPRSPEILPPGAGNRGRFANKCTACLLCVASCPEKIIEYRNGSVVLNLNKGACRFDCKVCTEVCPTGALLPLPLKEKQKTKIAQAVFLPQNCIVFQEDESCGKCAKACPVGAVKLRKNGTPLPVNTDLCIGCGACMKVCPAEKKAMEIRGIEQQILS